MEIYTLEVGKLSHVEKYVGILCQFLNWIGGFVLLVMMALTVFNIIIRIPSSAVPGLIELVSYLFVIVIFFGIAYAAFMGDHVDVSLVVSRFPTRVQAVTGSIIGILSLGTWVLIAFQGIAYGLEQFRLGEYSPALNMRLVPFRSILVLGCIMLCLVLLVQLAKHLIKAVRK